MELHERSFVEKLPVLVSDLDIFNVEKKKAIPVTPTGIAFLVTHVGRRNAPCVFFSAAGDESLHLGLVGLGAGEELELRAGANEVMAGVGGLVVRVAVQVVG